MVRLVNVLVDETMMETTMYEIDHHVCEEEEGTHADHNKYPANCTVHIIVQFAVAVDL